MQKLIDTHCHLNFADYTKDLSSVITNAKKAGVKLFIVPGVDINSSKHAINLSRKYPEIRTAIGIHPYEAQTVTVGHIKYLTGLIDKTTIAVGECGLDYHIYKGEKAVGKKYAQKKLLENQLVIAIKKNLPAIIHCRDAFDDLFDLLDSLPVMPRGVIHCFSGGLQDIRSAQKRGLFVGFDGNVTFSSHLKRIIPHVPPEMILLETDSPNLTPVPHRGKRNEPKFLIHTAKTLGELMGVSLSEITTVTTANANRLFSFSS